MNDLKIWVDADACPVPIKDILCRAAERKPIVVWFVANQYLNLPRHPNIKFLQVLKGFDVADNEIVSKVQSGDLVITSDIPLAAEIVEKGALGLSPRGEKFTVENIRAKLNVRDFMTELRSAGVETGGAAKFSHSDRQQFANQLDRILAKLIPS